MLVVVRLLVVSLSLSLSLWHFFNDVRPARSEALIVLIKCLIVLPSKNPSRGNSNKKKQQTITEKEKEKQKQKEDKKEESRQEQKPTFNCY